MVIFVRTIGLAALVVAVLYPTSALASHGTLLDHVSVRIECEGCSEETKTLVMEAANHARRGNPEFNLKLGWLSPMDRLEGDLPLFTISISEGDRTLRIGAASSSEKNEVAIAFSSVENGFGLQDFREFIQFEFGELSYHSDFYQPTNPSGRNNESILASHINLFVYSLWIDTETIKNNPRQSGSYFGDIVYEIHQTTLCDLRYDIFWKYIFGGRRLAVESPQIRSCSESIVEALQFAGYRSLKYRTAVHDQMGIADVWNYAGAIAGAVIHDYEVEKQYLQHPINYYEKIPDNIQENCQAIANREIVYLLQNKLSSELDIKINNETGQQHSRDFVRRECRVDLGEGRYIPRHIAISDMMLVEAGNALFDFDNRTLTPVQIKDRGHKLESLLVDYIDVYNEFGRHTFDLYYSYGYIYVLGAYVLVYQRLDERVGIEVEKWGEIYEKVSYWSDFCEGNACAGMKAAVDLALEQQQYGP
ncbi:MAG: hypothetical protein WEA84_14145 [Rhodovibrionaceae bacterium]